MKNWKGEFLNRCVEYCSRADRSALVKIWWKYKPYVMLAVGVVSVGATTGGASYLGTPALVATGKVTAVAVSSKVVGCCGKWCNSGIL